MPTRPSPRSERLGTPKIPAIRFTRGPFFEASLVRVCYGLSGCSPPWTDLTEFPWPTGDFYIQASGGSVALPVAGYDYNSNWTPLLAGLSPAGMAASLAAPDLTEFPQPPGAFTSRLPAGRSPFPSLDITTTATGLLCWRDFHPQEWQLASLHQTLLRSRPILPPREPRQCQINHI